MTGYSVAPKALGFAFGAMLVARQIALRGWGLAAGEATRALPGDDVISRPDQQLTHGVDVSVTPVDVWPWIAQLGYGRGGWYTPAWVDKYIWHVDNPSVDYIDPELQHVTPGDQIPDGPPGTAVFEVVAATAPEALVLHSRRHPITGVPPNLDDARPGPYLDFSWVFVLEPAGPTGSRLLLRTRGIAHVGSTAHAVGWLVWPPIDYLMSRWMLRGIKQRAEATGESARVRG